MDKHGITILYHHIGVDPAHHDIVDAKIGKGSINSNNYSCLKLTTFKSFFSKDLSFLITFSL